MDRDYVTQLACWIPSSRFSVLWLAQDQGKIDLPTSDRRACWPVQGGQAQDVDFFEPVVVGDSRLHIPVWVLAVGAQGFAWMLAWYRHSGQELFLSAGLQSAVEIESLDVNLGDRSLLQEDLGAADHRTEGIYTGNNVPH